MTFRFRPRYRGVAWTSIGVGGSLSVVAASLGFVVVPFAAGVLGLVLGAGYLVSPTWRLRVLVDENGLEVANDKGTRLRLAWSEVVRVTLSRTTNTCFIDGGEPARSLLVPGIGAPAPYDIEDRHSLVSFIANHVSADRIVEVELLESVVHEPVGG